MWLYKFLTFGQYCRYICQFPSVIPFRISIFVVSVVNIAPHGRNNQRLQEHMSLLRGILVYTCPSHPILPQNSTYESLHTQNCIPYKDTGGQKLREERTVPYSSGSTAQYPANQIRASSIGCMLSGPLWSKIQVAGIPKVPRFLGRWQRKCPEILRFPDKSGTVRLTGRSIATIGSIGQAPIQLCLLANSLLLR